MAKRKLGVSVIILSIAAITLISGTYAWFLVGGFANLFDIGFDVIESTGGLELRGDANTAEGGTKTWGERLDREDFVMYSFIAEKGKYKPVSSTNGSSFIAVGMENHNFKYDGVPASKTTATTPQDICYNDFTFYIRSTGEEIPDGGANRGAYIQIKLNGDKVGDDGEVVTDTVGAARAARVAVTIDGTTTIYDVDGENYNAVTTSFSDGTIVDVADGSGNYNQIIDGSDTGNAAAGLAPVSVTKLVDDEGNAIKIRLGAIPGQSSSNYATGKEITVRIWLEGNDLQCIDFGDNTIAGKSLMSYISFGVDE